MIVCNLFQINVSFLYTLKTSENQCFSFPEVYEWNCVTHFNELIEFLCSSISMTKSQEKIQKF